MMVDQVIKAAVALGYRIDALLAPADATGAGLSAVGHWLAGLRAGFSNRDTTQTGVALTRVCRPQESLKRYP